jgi:hypothetical protein
MSGRRIERLTLLTALLVAPVAGWGEEKASHGELTIEVLRPGEFAWDHHTLPPVYQLMSSGDLLNGDGYPADVRNIVHLAAAKEALKNKEGQAVIVLSVEQKDVSFGTLAAVFDRVREKLPKDVNLRLVVCYSIK